ncbi:YitT family protein [Glaciihabitans sp. dw_435]|uniref:membrane protein YczE n=1 Tax=Glaciihabitans sp. dw_435 TaxID=2720081 RepID=UPI001BD6B39D|nr:hypothetical protein [Glaciihabitans sp. dw_435]
MTYSLNVALRFTQLVVGLFLYGIAIAMMVRAGVGVGPWEVLTQGIAAHTGLEFGVVTNITGAVVLLLWIPLRQKPGIGTVLNVLGIGTSADVGLALIPVQSTPAFQVLLFAGGLALLAVATGLYVGAHFGPGPRDGLMLGITRRWGVKTCIARTSIEVTVVFVGWLLGGDVGLGTLAFALLIGPMVGVTLPLLSARVVPRPGRAKVAAAAQQGAEASAPALLITADPAPAGKEVLS